MTTYLVLHTLLTILFQPTSIYTYFVFQVKTSRKRKVNAASFIAKLDGKGQVPHSQDQFVNEMHPLDQQSSASAASAVSQIQIKEEPISDVDKDDLEVNISFL